MFGTPERTNTEGDVTYYIPLVVPKAVGAKYEVNVHGEIQPSLEFQEHLLTLKHTILSELANHTQIFRKPPTPEYLQAITPNWGCVLDNNTVKWNPYTILSQTAIPADNLPCFADLHLNGIFLSRSTITPSFSSVFLERILSNHLIDLDWAMSSVPDVEEVSDIQLPSAGFIELRDPAVMAKMKRDAKLVVKQAFQKATEAREEALQLAKQFTSKFEIADNESMFSEWLDGSESDEGEEENK
jgi:hypothetical protein